MTPKQVVIEAQSVMGDRGTVRHVSKGRFTFTTKTRIVTVEFSRHTRLDPARLAKNFIQHGGRKLPGKRRSRCADVYLFPYLDQDTKPVSGNALLEVISSRK